MVHLNLLWKYIIGTAGALILYFMAMQWAGFAGNPWLSIVNIFFMLAGMSGAMRAVYIKQGERFRYMDGFLSGLAMGFIVTLIFTTFFAIYIFELNPSYAEDIMGGMFMGYKAGPSELVLATVLFGMATTIVLALTIIPIFKQSWNIKKVRKQQKPLNQKS
jgi:hypothetical protein